MFNEKKMAMRAESIGGLYKSCGYGCFGFAARYSRSFQVYTSSLAGRRLADVISA